MPLNERQAKFCRELFEAPGNATRAAVRAGYAPKTAKAQAWRLLTLKAVKAELARLRQAAEDDAVMAVREACRILTAIVRSNVPDYYNEDGRIDIHRGDPRAIEQVKQAYDQDGSPTLTLKLTSKIAAIERLARLLGWDAPEKTETTIIEIRDPDGWGDGDYTEPAFEDKEDTDHE